MQRELELARREIAILRHSERTAAVEDEPRVQEIHEKRDKAAATPRASSSMNLKMIAELVNEFDGTPDNFDVWERQVNL